MDDCGIVETNLPHVHVLWERHGRVMHITTVNTEPPPPPSTFTRFSFPTGRTGDHEV